MLLVGDKLLGKINSSPGEGEEPNLHTDNVVHWISAKVWALMDNT